MPKPLKQQTPTQLRLAANNPNPEYGTTREEWEESVFRSAHHFNVVRYGVPGGSEIMTVDTFPKALVLAHDNPRALIYAVNLAGRAFCISRKDHAKFAEVWLGMPRGKTC